LVKAKGRQRNIEIGWHNRHAWSLGLHHQLKGRISHQLEGRISATHVDHREQLACLDVI